MSMPEFVRCKECVVPNTRPRISFDGNGVCNACNYQKRKKHIDWAERKKELEELCNRFRKTEGFDVIVPVSGGKNSSYVTWKLKHEHNMHPLCINVRSPLQTEIGDKNIDAFANSGFDLIEFTPNPKIAQQIDRIALKEFGMAQFSWLTALFTVPINFALKFGIKLIVYGEEGESEYGGNRELENKMDFDLDYVNRIYNQGKSIEKILPEQPLQDFGFLLCQKPEQLISNGYLLVHFSHFEKWDEDKHLEFAKEHCGYQPAKERSPGTYHNDWHLSEEKLYSLHMYLAYLKFGLARATNDASIDIRAGKISREQGLKLAEKYDSEFPKKYLKDYLDYFQMSKKEFFGVLNSFRAKAEK